MRRWARLGSLVVLLQGCAVQFDVRPGPEPESHGLDTAPARLVVQVRNPSLAPGGDPVLARPEDLRPGDIILTSRVGLIPAGIQLMTLTPVSHAAIYIGDDQVVEAVLSGVRVRSLQELLAEAVSVVALRYPELSAEQVSDIRAYALRHVGAPFNVIGLLLHMPMSIQRVACEMPLTPLGARDACIRTVGSIQYLNFGRRQFFCSQFVLQAYREANVLITDADPRVVSPADILHMREGDVPSFKAGKRLVHVGLLKSTPSVAGTYD
jgi:Permuted papain-like amidase enzyme, YaeF/YiiX, C92 family